MNTNVERNTKDLVAKVRSKYEKYPSIVAPVLESIHCVSQQFLAVLDSDGSLDVAQLEDLIDLNQGLLETLGVSHFSLRSIINIFAQHGESSHSNSNTDHDHRSFSLQVYMANSQEPEEEGSLLPWSPPAWPSPLWRR